MRSKKAVMTTRKRMAEGQLLLPCIFESGRHCFEREEHRGIHAVSAT